MLMVCSSSWLAYAVLIVSALRFSLSLDSARLFTMTVNLSTVLKWTRIWIALVSGCVTTSQAGRLHGFLCALCAKHMERLRAVRNYSSSFVDGICGTALKKDNVSKHQRSDMHAKSENMEHWPTAAEIYLGRALATASQEQTARVCKLFEVAYMLAKKLSTPPCWSWRKDTVFHWVPLMLQSTNAETSLS